MNLLKKIYAAVVIICSLSFVLIGCSESDVSASDQESSRSFTMGFTPWPYAATLPAVDDIYRFINTSGDLIAHHFDGGIPWPEALTANNFSNYGINVQNEINDRQERTNHLSNHSVYIAVTPFNLDRNGLAPYWFANTNEALPAPWDSFELDTEFVVSAYVHYLEELIKKLNPRYVNYAIEINEYFYNVPADAEKLQYFFANVYTYLKARHPDITFMVSFTLSAPGSAKMIETATLFNLIKDYVDMIGISAYPYAFYGLVDGGNPETLPDNWLSQITQIAPNKPYFIAETGFVGESLSIPAYGLEVISDEDKQASYVEALFTQANAINAEGIVWYTAYDFDILWADRLNDDLSKIWRDTGLKDGNQQPRKALNNWQQWLNRPVQ